MFGEISPKPMQNVLTRDTQLVGEDIIGIAYLKNFSQERLVELLS